MNFDRDTDKDWIKIAEANPFWGVLSQDIYQNDQMDHEKIKEFMRSGEIFIGNLFSLIKKHLNPEFVPKRALDFGCGVGRLSIPIARRVHEVVAVDIAPAMLELCQKLASENNLKNIRLCQSDDNLDGVIGNFDLVNTYIVLQHIQPSRGYGFIETMIDKLNIGGVGSIQITYAKSRKFFIHEQPKALYYRRDGKNIVDIIDSNWSPPEGTINMYDYDLNQVMAMLSRSCGHPVIALPTLDDDHLGVHFVFQKAR